jgi:hypothetical protein
MTHEGVRVFISILSILAGVIWVLSVVAMVVSIRAKRGAKRAAEDILKMKDVV